MGDVSEAKEIFTELKRQILERVDLSRDVSDEEMQELIDEVVISYGKRDLSGEGWNAQPMGEKFLLRRTDTGRDPADHRCMQPGGQ